MKGLENFKVGSPCVIVSNHQSILDMMGKQVKMGQRQWSFLKGNCWRKSSQIAKYLKRVLEPTYAPSPGVGSKGMQ